MRIVIANYSNKRKRKLKLSIGTSKHVYGIFWERRHNARQIYGGKSIFGYFKDSKTVTYHTRGWEYGVLNRWPKKEVRNAEGNGNVGQQNNQYDVAMGQALNAQQLQNYANHFGFDVAVGNADAHVQILVDENGNHHAIID